MIHSRAASNGSPPPERSEQPSYSASEAARILGLPAATITAWCFGQRYRSSAGDEKRFEPVITPAAPADRLLSFANLCELHVLSGIRRLHRVSLPKVRTSLQYLQAHLGSERPLLDTQFQTNGIDLFVEHASKLLNVSRSGQQALRGDFERALARIERNDAGKPIRLFPFIRPNQQDGSRVVAVDPTLSFGRPILLGAGVKTHVILSRFAAGDSIHEMAEDYRVTTEDIEEALRFEQRLSA
jgi:uncharacterized protein (DUF433 family)